MYIIICDRSNILTNHASSVWLIIRINNYLSSILCEYECSETDSIKMKEEEKKIYVYILNKYILYCYEHN